MNDGRDTANPRMLEFVHKEACGRISMSLNLPRKFCSNRTCGRPDSLFTEVPEEGKEAV